MNRLVVKYFKAALFALPILLLLMFCGPKSKKIETALLERGTFGYDSAFLSKYNETIILKKGNARLAVCPAYQGRLMTSSSSGESGLSYGWINYDLIESGEIPKHILPVGGEDRFWLGPEGGQFSLYFEPGTDFVFDNWQTPPPIDSEPFKLVAKDESSLVFEQSFELKNYSNHILHIGVRRTITFLDPSDFLDLFGIPIPSDNVAFQSINTLSNIGKNPWTKSSGAPSVWILGMFNPSEKTTILVPFREGEESVSGAIVNDDYFGKVPEERLVIGEGVIFFKGDGTYRSKIGLNPNRALPYIGSYDDDHNVLTIVYFNKPDGVEDYVNSMWELQEEPFAGDVVNAYNDGPVDGKAMGPFYELESSSPAAFLAPGQSLTHIHATFHIQGSDKELDPIIQKLFHTDIKQIQGLP